MDNSDEKKSKLPSIEGYQIEGPLSRTKSTVTFKATAEANRASVLITLSTGEAYRTNLKPCLDASFTKITKTLKLVEHPNIIPILDAGYVQEMPFTVTPYYPTGSLKQFVGTARNWRDVLSIMLPVADALAYCHDHGIIHRDVKPQNIVINSQGDLCLTNFSLLEPTATNRLSVTMTGSGECFPAYIAPEVWHGKLSPAVDQYSFGVMLYELLTATLPFDASNIVSLLVQQAAETVAPPSTLVSDVPNLVDALIEKILASDPAARFASMRDLRNVMQELLGNSNSTQKEIQSEKRSARTQKAKPPTKPEKKPPLPSETVQPEKPTGERPSPSQGKVRKENKAEDGQPKKRTKALTFVLFAVLAAVIVGAVIFLVGLLTDMGIITQLVDKLGAWVESAPLRALADETAVVPTASLLAVSPTTVQPSKVATPDTHYSLEVMGVGGSTGTQYYESSSPNGLPTIRIPGTDNTQVGSKGSAFIFPVAIETTNRVGVKLEVYNAPFILGKIHIFKDSEVEFLKDALPHVRLLRGNVFVSSASSQVIITSPILPNEYILLTGGQILVEVGRVNIKVWCLDGKCEIMRDGEWVNTILPLTRSVYLNNDGYSERESSTQILFGLVDELKQYNLACDSCMNVKALNPPK